MITGDRQFFLDTGNIGMSILGQDHRRDSRMEGAPKGQVRQKDETLRQKDCDTVASWRDPDRPGTEGYKSPERG